MALGALWLTRRCSGLKRLLICAAVLGPWLFALPLARAHDTDYDAYRPARSHHRRVEDHHRVVKDAWNEHIVAPFEDFANDVAELFTPNEETPERGETINPTPVEERCPWITDGVVGAARANPLTKALVERTRMSHPFGGRARRARWCPRTIKIKSLAGRRRASSPRRSRSTAPPRTRGSQSPR